MASLAQTMRLCLEFLLFLLSVHKTSAIVTEIRFRDLTLGSQVESDTWMNTVAKSKLHCSNR